MEEQNTEEVGFFTWLLDKVATMVEGREKTPQREREMNEQCLDSVEQQLHRNPELAMKALAAADNGLTSGIISPDMYQMLKRVEDAHSHTPEPSVVAFQADVIRDQKLDAPDFP